VAIDRFLVMEKAIQHLRINGQKKKAYLQSAFKCVTLLPSWLSRNMLKEIPAQQKDKELNKN